MILLPQARLSIIFSSYQYDTNESSNQINKKNIFFPSLSWSYKHSFQVGCMMYSSRHRLLFSIIERDKENIQNISSFHSQQARTKIRKLLSLYHQWRQSNRRQWLCSANYTITDFTRERDGSLVDLGWVPKSRKWRRTHGYANAV